MTFLKAKTVFSIGLFLTIFLRSDAQFLTPDQLREQHDIGYGVRTHYEMSGSRLTDMFRRINPDYLFRGFFPYWSVVLIAFALVFLLIAVVGLIGYFLGCRRPTPEELYASEFEQLTPDDEFLLGSDGVTNVDERKVSSNGYFDHTNQGSFRYDSQSAPRMERTRIGQSTEDMV